MVAKAAASEADLVFLDLEDSVAPALKVEARGRAAHALVSLEWGSKTRGIRINALTTEWAHGDVIEIVEIARDHLDVIIVPKIRSAQDVWWVDVLLSQLESKLRLSHRIGIEVLIEDVEAMINVEAIARASDRLEALIFGPGDYSASQGIRASIVGGSVDSYPGDLWHYARNKMIIAARAAGIDAIDGPYASFNDPVGYETECVRANVLGSAGKWAIHPSQIEIANRVFAPTVEEVAYARDICARYEAAQADGFGAIAVDGDMIDAATIRILQNVAVRGDLIGL
jgi:citrate lyase subunit beta/citryl-CoA lyase